MPQVVLPETSMFRIEVSRLEETLVAQFLLPVPLPYHSLPLTQPSPIPRGKHKLYQQENYSI